MTREIDPAIQPKTLDILRKRFKPADVAIDSIDVLSNDERRNLLLRIHLKSSSDSVPRSVILKQSLPSRGDVNNNNAIARFYRDWAGIEFASKIQEGQSTQYTPLFYASDMDLRFILIEDLGHPHVSLVESMAPAIPDRDKAISALERYMHALGRFNADSFEKTDRYETILKTIDNQAASAQEDLDSLSEHLLPLVWSNAETLGLSVTKDLKEEAQQVLNSIFTGPFTVLAHGDIALDNVFDHEEPRGLKLIDFELSSPRSALLDGVYLRMSMPTGWFAKRIPEAVLKPLELIYQAELQKRIPLASNELAYSTAYTHACAYYILHEMSVLNRILEKDDPRSSSSDPVPKDSLWEPATNTARPRLLTRLQTFIDVVTQHDRLHTNQLPILPNLKIMAEAMLEKVQRLWPDAKPLGFFPAFNQDSLGLSQSPPQESQSSTSQAFKTTLSEMRNNDVQSVDDSTKELSTNTAPTPFSIKPKTID